MRLFSIILVIAVIMCESATAGVLLGIPRGRTTAGQSGNRSTSALKSTNPQLNYRFRGNDVSYYFAYQKAQEQYERNLFKWERTRLSQLDKQQKAKLRAASFRARRSDAAVSNLTRTSSSNSSSGSKEVARDPRAWFNSKIAGSFGPRPSSQKTGEIETTKSSSSVAKEPRSSSALLDDQIAGDGAEAPAKKEGLWSKFLRVLGLKK